METPEQLYAQVFWRITASFGEIATFRQVANHGYPQARVAVLAETKQLVRDFVTDPHYDKWLTDKQGFLNAVGGMESFAESSAARKLEIFKSSVDAASLVFAHSVVDAAAQDLTRIVATIDPASFEERLGKKTFSLDEIKSFSYDQLRRLKIDELVSATERKSLLEKCDLLHSLCKPDAKFEFIRHFQFDRERLEHLDLLRHRVVHEPRIATVARVSDAELLFLKNSAIHLMGLLNFRHKLKMDPSGVQGAMRVPDAVDFRVRMSHSPEKCASKDEPENLGLTQWLHGIRWRRLLRKPWFNFRRKSTPQLNNQKIGPTRTSFSRSFATSTIANPRPLAPLGRQTPRRPRAFDDQSKHTLEFRFLFLTLSEAKVATTAIGTEVRYDCGQRSATKQGAFSQLTCLERCSHRHTGN
jgi:hypothetical protein